MNKIAFLIPIHLPHFKYAKNLTDSMEVYNLSQQADLWFIFTNEEEKEEFGEYKNSLVLPEELRNFENNGMINIKKFYGLSQIKNQYEYIFVFDAETLFIKNIDLEQVCNDFFEAKTLYGNKQLPEGTEKTEPIKSSCKRFFAKDKQIKNDNLYLWFNQPCIYKTATLDDFFEKINYKENAAEFSWYDFDYYIYMYYLIIYHNFHIEDIEIESNYGICEAGLDYLYFKSNKYEKIPIYMCSQAVFEKFDNPNLFILCHLDRDNVWMMRVTNIKIDNMRNEINNLNEKIDYLHEKIYELQKSINTKPLEEEKSIIKSKDITFILQGAIDKQYTHLCIDAIKKLFPSSRVILSTWEGEHANNCSYDKILYNKDPGGFKDKLHMTFTNNLLRQLVSTQNALEQAETKYTVKMRTDILIKNKNFLKYLDKYTKYEEQYKIYEKRIVTPSYFSKRFLTFDNNSYHIMPTPYQISDWFHFGLTEDIKKLYMVDLPNEPYQAEFFYKYDKGYFDKDSIMCSHQYAPEQYVIYNSFRKYSNNISQFEHYMNFNNKNISESEHYVINNFAIIQPKELGIVCLKERTNNDIDFYRRWCEHPLTLPFLVWNGLYRTYIYEKLYKEFCDNDYKIPFSVVINEYLERLLIARGRKCIIL